MTGQRLGSRDSLQDDQQGCSLPVTQAARLCPARGAVGRQGRHPLGPFPTRLGTVPGVQKGQPLERPAMRKEVLGVRRAEFKSQLRSPEASGPSKPQFPPTSQRCDQLERLHTCERRQPNVPSESRHCQQRPCNSDRG